MSNNGMIFPPSYYDEHWEDDGFVDRPAAPPRQQPDPEVARRVRLEAMGNLPEDGPARACPQCGEWPVYAEGVVCLHCHNADVELDDALTGRCLPEGE